MTVDLEASVNVCCYKDADGNATCKTRPDYVLVHTYKRKSILRVCHDHVNIIKQAEQKVLGAGWFPRRSDMYRGI